MSTRYVHRDLALGLSVALAACSHAPPAASTTVAGPPVAAPPAAVAPVPASPSPPTAPAVDLPNVHVGDGVATAGQPSLEQLAQARAAGYRAVINLRPTEETGTESAADVERLGLAYVSIPVAGPADLTEDKARALAAALALPGNQPAIVHCGSANRAGGLLALKAFFVDHRSAAESLELGRRMGLTKLEPAVKAVLDGAEKAREH